MANNEYPRKLTFKAPDTDRLTEDAKEHIRKVTEGTTITMLAENIIKIEYPAELIDHIKTVRVDYIDYRLDFIDHGNVYWMCNSVIYPSHELIEQMKRDYPKWLDQMLGFPDMSDDKTKE